jgi:hypothetical protein
VTTRTRMSKSAKRGVRRLLGDKPEIEYLFVPSDVPVIIGLTATGTSILTATGVGATPTQPIIGLSDVDAPAGMQWLTATMPLYSSATFRLSTPFGATETFVAKAALPADLLTEDHGRLAIHTATLHVTARTQQAWHRVRPVVARVGQHAAARSIMLATWLTDKWQDVDGAAAWLTNHHPDATSSEKNDLSALTGSGYEQLRLDELRQLLLGAHCFMHPKN